MEGVIERLVEISESRDEGRKEEGGRREEEGRREEGWRREEGGRREEEGRRDEGRRMDEEGSRREEEEARRDEERRWKKEGINESILIEVSDAIKKKGGKSEFSFEQPVKSEWEFDKNRSSVVKEDNSLNFNQNRNVQFSVEEPPKDKIKKTELLNEITRKSVMRNQTFFFDSAKTGEEIERKRFQTCPHNDRFQTPLETPLDMETETKFELEGIYIRAMKEVEGQ